jgi:hypothetical protein
MVKRTREEMKTTLENRKKAIANSPKSAFKRKNTIEEGVASSLEVKKEHESIDLRAQKMMRDRMEPFTVPIVVQAVKQITVVP